jgi:DNA-binding Lrp family transcriptional regulator
MTSRRRPSPGEAGQGDRPLDEVDHAILAALRADGRLSMIELAQRAGISRGSAYTRFERLRREGVIKGFTARLDPRRLGLTVAAYVNLNVVQDEWRAVRGHLLAMSEVEHVALVAGRSDFVVLVRARDVEDLREVVIERLHKVPGVRSTLTTLILDEATPEG